MKENRIEFQSMTKEELFKKYSIDESHSKWEGVDTHMSIELYRLMHDGALPPPNDISVYWIIEFLDKTKDGAFMRKLMMSKFEWGSLFLTAKRLLYQVHQQILESANRKA